MSENEQERQHEAMPEWYRVLSEVRDESGDDPGTEATRSEVRDALTDALIYVDEMRAAQRRAADSTETLIPDVELRAHWVPVEVSWSAVEPGDVILAPPRGSDVVGTPHMILRAATKHDGTMNARWVQAVGGGEVEPRNAKRDESATVTVLMPVELARARETVTGVFGLTVGADE